MKTEDFINAIRRNEAGTVERLLHAGADPNAKDRLTQTNALGVAAWDGHMEVARVLISFGADIDSRDERHETPLITAASQGFTDFVRLLVESGADITLQDEHGHDALIIALSWSYTGMIEILNERMRAIEALRRSHEAATHAQQGMGGRNVVIKRRPMP